MADQNIINLKDVKGVAKSKKENQDSSTLDNQSATQKISQKDSVGSRKRKDSGSPSTSQQSAKKQNVMGKDSAGMQGLRD